MFFSPTLSVLLFVEFYWIYCKAFIVFFVTTCSARDICIWSHAIQTMEHCSLYLFWLIGASPHANLTLFWQHCFWLIKKFEVYTIVHDAIQNGKLIVIYFMFSLKENSSWLFYSYTTSTRLLFQQYSWGTWNKCPLQKASI